MSGIAKNDCKKVNTAALQAENNTYINRYWQ